MKRDIALYIGSQKADLAEDNLILFNYRKEDLDSPAVVKNSYSQKVTLPGTPANNAIFGSIFRLDHKVGGSGGTGTQFDPSQKVGFVIFRGSEVLESGYLKLDGIETKDGVVSYSVTLYGGLGSFLYNLAYDNLGNEKSLASLAYGAGSNPATEFDYEVSKESIAEAWEELYRGNTAGKWACINFAPCYNGIPGENFSADKAIFRPADNGQADSVTDGGVTYTTKNGWSLATLGREVSEWEAKDLRSQLQRPVISVKRVLQAIADPANNGGWTVELDNEFFNAGNGYFNDAWMTLPMPEIVESEVQGEVTEQISFEGTTTSQAMEEFVIKEFDAEKSGVSCQVGLSLKFSSDGSFRPDASSAVNLSNYYSSQTPKQAGVILQLIGYNGRGEAVSRSLAKLVHTNFDYYDPNNGSPILRTRSNLFTGSLLQSILAPYGGGSAVKVSIAQTGVATVASGSLSLEMAVPSSQVAKIVLQATCVAVNASTQAVEYGSGTVNYKYYMVIPGVLEGWAVANDGIRSQLSSTGSSTVTYQDVTSGRAVTKQSLLGGTMTPAAFLTSFCKMYGLSLVADASAMTVRILTRNTFFREGLAKGVMDLSSRMDVASVKQIPHIYDARWYRFAQDMGDAAFAKAYRDTYGKDFGEQQVNTGYAFDASTKDAISGLAFKGCVEALESSPAFYQARNLTLGKDYSYALFFSPATYLLYNGENTKEVNAERKGVVVTALNLQNKGYDVLSKPQFHDEKQGTIDGSYCLLLFRGFEAMDAVTDALHEYRITDDNSVMADLNGGVPCWILNDPNGIQPDAMPMFGRMFHQDGEVTATEDFGSPKALAVPGLTLRNGSGLYARFWAAYLADRYDTDTRQVTVKVNFSGIQVGHSLLQRFYWFGGALWVLNAIKNHSITTDDLTECEFIKVMNTVNYTEGQIMDIESGLTVSPQTIEANASSKEVDIIINYPGQWAITGTPSWATLNISSGSGRNTVHLSIAANNTSAARTATLTVTAEDGTTKSIAVSQAVSHLSITPTSLAFPSRGYSQSVTREVTIASDLPWHFSGTKPSWLNVDKERGNGGAPEVVIFTVASDNTGTSDRTATVTVTDGTRTVSLSLTQSAAALSVSPTALTFAASGEAREVLVSSDYDWTISGIPSWITASRQSGPSGTDVAVTLTAAANDQGQRSATITFTAGSSSKTVTVSQAIGHLSVDPLSLTFDPQGEAKTITLTSDVPWTASLPSAVAAWVTVSPMSGPAGTMSVTVRASGAGSSARDGYIAFGAGNVTQNLVVNQGANAGISANPSSIAIPAEGDSEILTVLSNVSWSIVSKPDWVRTNPSTGGSGTTGVTVSADANVTGVERSGEIVVQSVDGTVSARVAVSQAVPAFAVEPTSLSWPWGGGSKTFRIQADEPWSINILTGAAWLSVSQLSGGPGVTNVTVVASQHTSALPRYATIAVVHGSTSVNVDCEQAAYSAETLVGPQSLEFVSGVAPAQTVNVVKGSGDVYEMWSLDTSNTESWVHFSKSSGQADDSFNVTVDVNYSNNSRTTTFVVVLASGNVPVTVKQNGQEYVEWSLDGDEQQASYIDPRGTAATPFSLRLAVTSGDAIREAIGDFQITSNQPWASVQSITPVSTLGSIEYIVTLNVAQNNDTASPKRSVVLTATGKYGTQASITLYQSNATPATMSFARIISYSPLRYEAITEQTMPSGLSTSFIVASNKRWRIKAKPSWLHRYSGDTPQQDQAWMDEWTWNNSGAIEYDEAPCFADANTTGSIRSATLTIVDEIGTEANLLMVQL